MRITRQLPTGSALTAAHDALFDDASTPDEHDSFSVWFNARRLPGRTDPLVHIWQVSLDEAQTLVEECPNDCGAGVAWATEMRRVIDMSVADSLRDYDRFAYDEAEQAAIAAIESYVEGLCATSPLLGPVADTLDSQVLGGILNDLGDIAERRRQVTADGVYVAEAFVGDRYDDRDDAAPKGTVLVPWRHIDLLRSAAGAGTYRTRKDVEMLLGALDATLPPFEPGDGGVARGAQKGD